MIPSRNQTNPQYSFGREKRIKRSGLPKTDYIYSPKPEHIYKYYKVLSFLIFFRILNGNLALPLVSHSMKKNDMLIMIIRITFHMIKKILNINGTIQ